MSCGGRKTFPRTLFIVQIIFSFWSFGVSEGILRNQIIGCDSISNQRFNIFGPIWILLVIVSTALVKDAKLQGFALASCCQIYRVTEEA